jgi:hypothetical protein
MQYDVIQYLTKLIQDDIIIDPRDSRLTGFLLDHTRNAAKREINLLTFSLKTTIPDEIRNAEAGKLDQLFVNRMKKRLVDELGITDENALWIIQAWASAYAKETVSTESAKKSSYLRSVALSESSDDKSDAKETSSTSSQLTEQERLLRELEILPRDGTSHKRRMEIGNRLAEIGDQRPGVGVKNGIPYIEWVPVTLSGTVKIIEDEWEGYIFTVKPFLIAKYLLTYQQYQAFVSIDYNNPRWWQGLSNRHNAYELKEADSKVANAPRDNVSWYQAVAFTRWLNDKL